MNGHVWSIHFCMFLLIDYYNCRSACWCVLASMDGQHVLAPVPPAAGHELGSGKSCSPCSATACKLWCWLPKVLPSTVLAAHLSIHIQQPCCHWLLLVPQQHHVVAACDLLRHAGAIQRHQHLQGVTQALLQPCCCSTACPLSGASVQELQRVLLPHIHRALGCILLQQLAALPAHTGDGLVTSPRGTKQQGYTP